jgi:hypothetical protein
VTEFERLLTALLAACQQQYGDRLISALVYGSVGRGTPQSDSDIDLLIVADPLPAGRWARVAEFEAVEREMAGVLEEAAQAGIHTFLSHVFKTPHEVSLGSPLFLDMIDDRRILFDRNGFIRDALAAFKARLDKLGARRVWQGDAWYWDLKPDYKPGEVFEI